MQFHLYFEKLIMKGSQHKSKDGAACTRAEKDLSHGFIIVQLSFHLITHFKPIEVKFFK